jgi:uncharacterized protein YifE (UPF0438 family)
LVIRQGERGHALASTGPHGTLHTSRQRGAVRWRIAATVAQAPAQCTGDLEYRISGIDAGFNVTYETVDRITKQAAARRNEAVGRRMITLNSRAAFTIHFRYGDHQRTGNAIAKVQGYAARRSKLLDKMSNTLRALAAGHEQSARHHRNTVTRFERDARQFKTDVDAWQTLSPRAHNRATTREALEVIRKQLDKRQSQISRRSAALNRSRSEILSLKSALMERFSQHNRTVQQANAVLESVPKDALKLGVTHINGPPLKQTRYRQAAQGTVRCARPAPQHPDAD